MTLFCLILYNLLNAVLSENMNGAYVVASGGGKQNVSFNSDYASKGMEYFEIYAPEIASHYGDVFWTSQGVIPLPEDIIKRFAGKVIAITGYEHDQVMVQPQGEPGVNPDKDVSVPINWVYNHHYMLWMTGNYSTLKKEATTKENMWYHHGLPYRWIAEELPHAQFRNDLSIPTSQLFSEGNGGESRKSFHGYPNGYAQLIESPQSYHLTPMQIDTRNRDCGAGIYAINNCTKFIPGIEPLQARYGRGIPKDTNYSGLLECPCDGKFGGDPLFYGENTLTKQVTHEYVTLQSTTCSEGESLTSATLCFDAVYDMGFPLDTKIVNKTVTDPSIPYGCSVSGDENNNIIYAYYQSATSQKPCSTDHKMYGNTVSDVNVSVLLEVDTTGGDIAFIRSSPGEYCSLNHNGVLKAFPAASNGETDQINARNACEGYCKTDMKCTVCSVDCSLTMKATSGQCQWSALTRCGSVLSYDGPNGLIDGDISWKNQGVINITISGPSNVWFGVGFNAQTMSDEPWTLIINSTDVWEQKIGTCGSEADHCPGTTLNKTIRVLSNAASNGVRTVVIQREGLIGATEDYYSFTPSDGGTINLITAIGESQTFAYHHAHADTKISLVMETGNTCICDTGANGKLCEPDGGNCRQFVKWCVKASTDGAPPDGALLAQRNPTCNSRQYSGGLQCCINGKNLLDANQTIPKEVLHYHLKFRFWFQEYNVSANGVSSHYNLDRIYQQTEANAGEYDIPPAYALDDLPVVGYENWPKDEPTPGTICTGNCPNGADCECVHEIHYRWIESPTKPMRLIYAGGHCHAPACISIKLYRNDTGEVLCEQIPIIGQGNVDKDKYDEAGYIAIPPCLWGEDDGLTPSVLLPAGTPLLSIKKNNNTHLGHFGEMASWQMRATFF